MAYKNKEDQAAYAKKHYEANKVMYKQKAVRLRAEKIASNKRLVNEVKAYPCQDCGQTYPHYVMDLDHRSDKVRNISDALWWSTGRLITEIMKCDLVCANCHRERTHQRRNS